MSKDYIKGFLAGDPIEIICTKRQGELLRARLSDWLDESVIKSKIEKGESLCVED